MGPQNRLCLVALLALVFAAGVPLGAQIVEEDLDFLEQYEGVPPEVVDAFHEAEDLFRSPSQEESRDLFGQVIRRLEPLDVPGAPLPVRGLMLEALSYRARASYNLGDELAARQDLRRLLMLDPTATLDVDTVSPKLAELFQSLQQERLAFVQITIDPNDARIRLVTLPTAETALIESSGRDSSLPTWTLQPGVEAPVPAGRYRVELTRPGFGPKAMEIALTAGERLPIEATLDRSSAVLVVRTRPPAARVFLDGKEVGVTPLPDPGANDRDLSGVLWVDGLFGGEHRLEIEVEGYRPYRARVGLIEMADRVLQPIDLQRQVATLLVRGIPEGGELQLDGHLVQPRFDARREVGRIELMPGIHRLVASRAGAGVFETDFELADGESRVIEVRLRPPLILVGVVGDDDNGRATLLERLRDAIAAEGTWTLLDRSSQGEPLLERLGVGADDLRRPLQGARSVAEVDWAAVQHAIDLEIPGRAFVLAVLDDDLIARQADLHFWSPAPGPAQPDRRRITLAEEAEYVRIADALTPIPQARRVSIGAVMFDSEAAAAPVVASVAPDGPAALAGLRIGDQIIAVGGVPIFTYADITKRLGEVAPDETLELEVQTTQRAGNTQRRTLSLQPVQVRSTVDLADIDTVRAAVAAEILAALDRESDERPRWLLELDRALLHMQAMEWERAVDLLRSIDAPTGERLGQATVDYCLGIALTNAGPRYYDLARDALERAAGNRDGRLFRDDGPWVAPRARARLASLGGGR